MRSSLGRSQCTRDSSSVSSIRACVNLFYTHFPYLHVTFAHTYCTSHTYIYIYIQKQSPLSCLFEIPRDSGPELLFVSGTDGTCIKQLPTVSNVMTIRELTHTKTCRESLLMIASTGYTYCGRQHASLLRTSGLAPKQNAAIGRRTTTFKREQKFDRFFV